jgi:hypothetical protein
MSDMSLYRVSLRIWRRGKTTILRPAAEHRKLGYPTSPAPVFRMPTLAIVLLVLQTNVLRLVALSLVYGAIMILLYRETAG